MPHAIATPPRHMFWHEIAYAIKASNPRKEWDIDHIIREIARVPEHSHHVPFPILPISVDGLEVDQLADFVNELKAEAGKRTEPYVKRGVTRMRKQSIIKPIMIVGVASYPEPELRDTAERRRWIGLVVDALKGRMEADGGRLVSVVLHLDESFAHLHCICVSKTPGALVRNLNWAQLASDAELVKSQKGKAFREVGGVRIQDWFFATVGEKMGWLRNRPEGERMPRLTPSQNNRIRQKRLEEQAAKIEAEELRLIARQHSIDERELMLEERKAKLAADAQRRMDELELRESALQRQALVNRENSAKLKNAINLQAAKQAGIDKQWEIIGRKVDQMTEWEQTIRTKEEQIKEQEMLIQDHFAWEQHKLRGTVPKMTPSRSGRGAIQDDDLDDVPF
jgi:hypothetical protein